MFGKMWALRTRTYLMCKLTVLPHFATPIPKMYTSVLLFVDESIKENVCCSRLQTRSVTSFCYFVVIQTKIICIFHSYHKSKLKCVNFFILSVSCIDVSMTHFLTDWILMGTLENSVDNHLCFKTTKSFLCAKLWNKFCTGGKSDKNSRLLCWEQMPYRSCELHNDAVFQKDWAFSRKVLLQRFKSSQKCHWYWILQMFMSIAVFSLVSSKNGTKNFAVMHPARKKCFVEKWIF